MNDSLKKINGSPAEPFWLKHFIDHYLLKNLTWISQSKVLSLLIPILLATLVYFPCLWAGWYFDDYDAVIKNPHAQQIPSLSDFIGTFTQRRIVNLSYAFDWTLTNRFHLFYAVDRPQPAIYPSAFVFHLSSLVYHWLTLVALYVLILKLCGLRDWHESSSRSRVSPLPFLCVLLFAVHPIHTDAVTYVSGRSSVLVTFEYLVGFVSFLIFLESIGFFSPHSGGLRPSNKIQSGFALLVCFLCFLAGVGTKPTIVTLFPLGVIVFALLSLPRLDRRLWIKRVGILSLLILIPVMLFVVQRMVSMSHLVEYTAHQSASIWQKGLWLLVGGNDVYIRPWWVNLLSQVGVIGLYYLPRQLALLPMGLDPQVPEIHSLLNGHFVIGLLMLVVLIILLLRSRRSNVLVSIGILWYLVTLLPTSSFIPLFDLASERHVYLPNVGFLLALSAGLLEGFQNTRSQWRRNFSGIVLFACLILFCGASFSRNLLYTNPVLFWKNEVKQSPNKARPYVHLGTACWEAHQPVEALEAYKKALSINPYIKDAAVNLGMIFLTEFHDYSGADVIFQQCIALWPDWHVPRANLGACYIFAGRYDEARKLAETWLSQDSNNLDANLLLGSALLAQGESNRAQQLYQLILSKFGEVPQALRQLSKIAMDQGKVSLSQEYESRALRVETSRKAALGAR